LTVEGHGTVVASVVARVILPPDSLALEIV
jgi:hypothetical protein